MNIGTSPSRLVTAVSLSLQSHKGEEPFFITFLENNFLESCSILFIPHLVPERDFILFNLSKLIQYGYNLFIKSPDLSMMSSQIYKKCKLLTFSMEIKIVESNFVI
jgi:hypothetical protein